VTVFQGLFNDRSLFMDLKTGTNSSKTGKDTFYRFINSCSVNWMRFTSLLAERIINSMVAKLTDENRVNVFIVGDTLYERSILKSRLAPKITINSCVG